MDHTTGLARKMGSICGMALMVTLALTALAQQPGTSSRATDRAVAMKDLTLRDSEVRSLEIARDNARDPSRPKAPPERIEQVKQDFGRIQEINSQIMRGFTGGGAPDYKYISASMAEINKRAHRLRTNLLLPESASDEKRQDRQRSPLLDLNDLIIGFVTNPIFKDPNRMDADLATKAKRDLTGIIDLSRRIEKSANKLAANGKPK
jgi:hypothetical protein